VTKLLSELPKKPFLYSRGVKLWEELLHMIQFHAAFLLRTVKRKSTNEQREMGRWLWEHIKRSKRMNN
jgi:hypothetical protein